MTAHRISALLALSVVALSGCADFGGPISGSGEPVLSPEERRLQDLENKVAILTRRLDAVNLTSVDQENARMREELRELRGIVEKLRYDSDTRERTSKDMYLDLDRRLQRFEGTAPPVLGGPGTMPGATPGTLTSAPPTAQQRAVVASPEEEAAYLGAVDLYKKGKPDDAIRAFRSMLDRWPQGRYADNAWFWMGQASFIKRDYSAALSSFQSLVDRFPTSPKLADSLVKIGQCLHELKRTNEARATLQRVTREFPGTPAASQARQTLEVIRE